MDSEETRGAKNYFQFIFSGIATLLPWRTVAAKTWDSALELEGVESNRRKEEKTFANFLELVGSSIWQKAYPARTFRRQ